VNKRQACRPLFVFILIFPFRRTLNPAGGFWSIV